MTDVTPNSGQVPTRSAPRRELRAGLRPILQEIRGLPRTREPQRVLVGYLASLIISGVL